MVKVSSLGQFWRSVPHQSKARGASICDSISDAFLRDDQTAQKSTQNTTSVPSEPMVDEIYSSGQSDRAAPQQSKARVCVIYRTACPSQFLMLFLHRTSPGKFPEVCGRSKFPENCALSVVNALFLGFYALCDVNVVFLACYALYGVNAVFSAESYIRRALRTFCLSGPVPFCKLQGPRSGFEGMDAKTTVTFRSEFRIPNAELRTPNSEFQAPSSKLQAPNSKLQECRMPNAECRMPNAECRMPNAECRMPNYKFLITNS